MSGRQESGERLSAMSSRTCRLWASRRVRATRGGKGRGRRVRERDVLWVDQAFEGEEDLLNCTRRVNEPSLHGSRSLNAQS